MRRILFILSSGVVWALCSGLVWVAPPMPLAPIPKVSFPELRQDILQTPKAPASFIELEKRWRTERLLGTSA